MSIVSIFTVGINLKLFYWTVHSVQKIPQIFGDVRKPSTPLCRLADRRGKKAGLNWKL